MRENLEGSLCHLESAKALHMKLKKNASDRKLNWNLTKLKYAANDTIKEAKRQPTGWQRIFADRISDKELMSI